MPNFDKTGPNGDGPQTGRKRGVNRPRQGQGTRQGSRQSTRQGTRRAGRV